MRQFIQKYSKLLRSFAQSCSKMLKMYQTCSKLHKIVHLPKSSDVQPHACLTGQAGWWSDGEPMWWRVGKGLTAKICDTQREWLHRTWSMYLRLLFWLYILCLLMKEPWTICGAICLQPTPKSWPKFAVLFVQEPQVGQLRSRQSNQEFTSYHVYSTGFNSLCQLLAFAASKLN